MAKRYTLVTVEHHPQERYEALYSDGRLIAESEDRGFNAVGLLEALAMDTIAVEAEYVDLKVDYDEEHIANEGWPESLDAIPEDARV